MKIVCISDTHCQLEKVSIPDGDVLVHTGDITYSGTIEETHKELSKLSKLKDRFKHIVLVEGNHDWLGHRNPTLMDQMCKDNGVTLLRDSSAFIDGVLFYGAPWQPEFHGWAFNLPRGQALKMKWALMPYETQVLLTHCPPNGVLDGVERFNTKTGVFDIEHVGCVDLYNRVSQLNDLKLHVFGHIHEGAGSKIEMGVNFINASTCNGRYKTVNPPIIVNI